MYLFVYRIMSSIMQCAMVYYILKQAENGQGERQGIWLLRWKVVPS